MRPPAALLLALPFALPGPLSGLAPATALAADAVPVRLEARLVDGAPALEGGVVWRVFRDAATPTSTGLELAAETTDAVAAIDLAPGTYYVHAAFGRAGVTQRLDVEAVPVARSLVLHAGALRLDATSGGRALDPERLRFNIYRAKPGRSGVRRLVAFDLPPRRMVRLNAGTYHVVSTYGRVNTQVRADLVVREGEVTDATLQHRGAPVTLRLASEPGGPPVASTRWAVFTAQGQKVFETARIAPSLVLAEGSYEAVATNGERTLRHPFEVEAGDPVGVEIVLP